MRNIMRFPNHTWYLAACSKGISIRRRRIDPLVMGRKRKAKQDKAIKPKEYADICNIKTLKSGTNQISMETQLMDYGPSVH
jgi:hypothetical protein